MSITHLEQLSSSLQNILESKLVSIDEQFGELTAVVRPEDMLSVSELLRDRVELNFDTLIDLCGIDYIAYGRSDSLEINEKPGQNGTRFAVIYHLLSVENNNRLRVKVFAGDDVFPVVDSVIGTWPAVNWFEREAFDLFGIVFTGHPDLRRILTDYGFIGNPFRKDFPITGNVEMRYDAEQKRVIYQPVSIEPREITPHVIRETGYGDGG